MSKHHNSKPEMLHSTGETDLRVRIAKALRDPEPGSQVEIVVRKWRNFDFTVSRNGEWFLEGFVNFFQMHHEIARAVDPSFPDKLPAHCFSAEHIAKLFRLPEDAFSEQYLVDSHETDRLLENMNERLLEIHHTTVQGPKQRLASLTPIQQDLYEVASEDTLMLGKELCELTGLHDYDSNARTAISNLYKCGLLRKSLGKRGYIKVPL